MQADLAEKAKRAAEWFNSTQDTLTAEANFAGWGLYFRQGGTWTTLGSDRLMIAFCEDRGWQDTEPEPYSMQNLHNPHNPKADGVEWHVGSEWAHVNGHTIAIECGQNLFTWVVFKDGNPEVDARSNPVTPPHTRAEARRQAVEAARGMG